MRISCSFINFSKLILSSTLLCSSLAAQALTINLYDQPKTDAKVVATINPANGIIPIFSPKDSTWVKIADPANGNVGWVKSDQLSNTGNMQFTFTQSITNNKQVPATYRVIQFGQPKPLTSEQAQAITKEMQMRQQAIQHSMREMMRDMDKFISDDWHFMHTGNFPVFMPVVMVPVQNASNNSHAQQTSKTVSLQKTAPANTSAQNPDKPEHNKK